MSSTVECYREQQHNSIDTYGACLIGPRIAYLAIIAYSDYS